MTSYLFWLSVAALIALATAGYGLAVARLAKLDWESRLERTTISIGLGFGVLTSLVFIAGLLRLMTIPVFLILVIPAAAVGLTTLRKDVTTEGGVGSRFAQGALVLLVICGVLNVAGSLAPPSFIDPLIYHLFAPREFLRHRSLVEIPTIWQLYLPISIEMLFTVAHAFGGPRVAAVLTAGLGLLTAAATVALGRRLGDYGRGLVAAAIFYCTAMTAWESTSCLVDLGTAALGTLGLYALLRWHEVKTTGWFTTAGLLLGFAATCKLNGAAYIIAGVVVEAYAVLRTGDGIRTALSRSIRLGAIAAVPLVPYYLRSFLLTGNPIYPFGTSLFGDNPWRPAITWIFKSFGVGYGLTDRLMAPWNVFAAGVKFENGQHFNPLPMLMAPVIIWRAFSDRRRELLLVAAVVLLALWAGGAHIARYLLPVQPVLCVLAADALYWLASFPGRRRVMALGAGALFLLFGTVNTILYDKQFLPVLLGRESESSFLDRNAWYHSIYADVCAAVPPGGRVLTNMGPTYYLDCPHERGTDEEFVTPGWLERRITDGHFTNVLILGRDEVDATISRSPRVRRLWRREVPIVVSRSFGGFAKAPAALFEVTTR